MSTILHLNWMQLLLGGGTAGNRERVKKGEDFSTRIHLFGMPEEHILRKYHFPSHVFYLLQETKDNLKPSSRSHAIPALSKLLQPFIFWPPVLFNILWLLYSLFTIMLICMLRWSVCKWDVASVFFNLRIVSKSPADISTPICTVLERCSRLNWLCLIKLVLKLQSPFRVNEC